MNKLEAKYAEELERQKAAGEVLWYSYEAIRFRIAHNTNYTPDFLVLHKDYQLQIVEIKGYWLPESRLRVKTVAEMFPIRMTGVMWDKKKGGWVYEEFSI